MIWQIARVLSRDAYAIASTISQRDYGFCDQIRRASVSVMNNIAEGFERGSNKDFMKYLFISRGSCGEVRSLCYVALDQEYITQAQFDNLTGQCRQCSAAIWGLIKSLSKTSTWTEIVPTLLLTTLCSIFANP
ncbi:MAG: four helix bundle protein [bacterium]